MKKKEATREHTHEFKKGRSKTTETCDCGRFRNVVSKENPAIVEIKSPQTPTNWFLVVNTPGVDIRHKVDGQELTLVENVNYQIANKIMRAVNLVGSLRDRFPGLFDADNDDEINGGDLVEFLAEKLSEQI